MSLQALNLNRADSFDACPNNLRPDELLKITSIIDSPRKFLAELSPITQRTASIILDLPQPLGPTTATNWLGKGIIVGSTKDLNPASFNCFNCMKRIIESKDANYNALYLKKEIWSVL